jgi:hypothetical protein
MQSDKRNTWVRIQAVWSKLLLATVSLLLICSSARAQSATGAPQPKPVNAVSREREGSPVTRNDEGHSLGSGLR